MKSIPPKTDAVDDAWAAGGEGEADFDLAGLFVEPAPRAKPAPAAKPAPEPAGDEFAMVDLGELFIEEPTDRPTPVPGAAEEPQTPAASAGDSSGAPGKSSRSTLRPPQPEAEYVADMMERALSPWPAAPAPPVDLDRVPAAGVPAFPAEEAFDFAELGAGPGTVPYGTMPPPARRASSTAPGPVGTGRPPAADPVDLGADLDLELDRALGSRAPQTMPSARESTPPQTQRGLGDSSVPPAGSTPTGMDPVEILEFGPPTPPSNRTPPPSGRPPQPSANRTPPPSGRPPQPLANRTPPPSSRTPPPLRAAPSAPGPSAPPPRLAPRPRSDASVRPGERTPPSLDTPFAQGAAPAAARQRTPPAPRPRDPLRLVQDRFELGDYSGALVQAEAMLEDRPNDADALRYAEACRVQLLQMYLSRIGDRTQVPRVVMEQDQLRWLSLDHRAGFLLSMIDGSTPIDDILDVSGMSELDTLRILYDFVLQGVIQMGPQRRRWR